MKKISYRPSCGNPARLHVLVLSLALGLVPAAVAQLGSFSVIEYPGAILTSSQSINDAGDIVGRYTAPDKKVHGFLLRRGQFTTIDFPGGAGTGLMDINLSGDIAGWYDDAAGKRQGFLLRGDRFTPLAYPGAQMSNPTGMNAKGEIVGMYYNLTGDTTHRGYLFSGGRFTSFEHPQAGRMSCFFAINDNGDMMGHWQDTAGVRHGWLVRQGRSSSFDFPGANQTMLDVGAITNAGDIAGAYEDPRGKAKGFLLRQGSFTPFDIPGSRATTPLRMNASGQIVGRYEDAGGVTRGFLTRVVPASRSQLLTVDDDGADCPGALRTIQEAVAQAPAGATIQVCPGIYFKSVTIAGPEKNGLKLIAQGRENEVVLQGDYTERDGFHLENVSNVLVRGFTVRDFGRQATTEAVWGIGANIYLSNSHYNSIEHNRLINGDMGGIRLVDSGDNVVQFNSAFADNLNLATCGIRVAGAKSVNNLVRQNLSMGNKMAGMRVSGAGPGNVVIDNTVISNGREGIAHSGTTGTWIEGNRVSYGRGPWGTSPYAKELIGLGIGINLSDSDKVTVFDNRLRSNTGGDVNWDGKGTNKFESNACETSTPAGGCGR